LFKATQLLNARGFDLQSEMLYPQQRLTWWGQTRPIHEQVRHKQFLWTSRRGGREEQCAVLSDRVNTNTVNKYK